MELTALLVAATARADGDMSSDEKRAILDLFAREFRLSERDAASLLTSSTHLPGRRGRRQRHAAAGRDGRSRQGRALAAIAGGDGMGIGTVSGIRQVAATVSNVERWIGFLEDPNGNLVATLEEKRP